MKLSHFINLILIISLVQISSQMNHGKIYRRPHRHRRVPQRPYQSPRNYFYLPPKREFEYNWPTDKEIERMRNSILYYGYVDWLGKDFEMNLPRLVDTYMSNKKMDGVTQTVNFGPNSPQKKLNNENFDAAQSRDDGGANLPLNKGDTHVGDASNKFEPAQALVNEKRPLGNQNGRRQPSVKNDPRSDMDIDLTEDREFSGRSVASINLNNLCTMFSLGLFCWSQNKVLVT